METEKSKLHNTIGRGLDSEAGTVQGESSGRGEADGSGLFTDVARGDSGGSYPSALIAPPLPLARSYHSTRFVVNDLVTWMGVNGKVIEDFKNMRSSESAALTVEFEARTQDFGGTNGFHRMKFLRDGRLLPWHLEPSLKLRAK